MLNRQYIKVKIADLVPYDRNPRKNQDAIKPVADSIKSTGYISPVIIDESNNILAGHTRILALKSLNETEIEVLKVEGLTEKQKTEYRILDNKTGEIAEWDFEILDADFTTEELLDFGFDQKDLLQSEIIEDEAPPLPETPRTVKGDIYQLGNHRVMCGNSTIITDVERLMDGKKADMVFTDPPYNIDYKGLTEKHEKIKNDKMSDDDFVIFLKDSLMSCETMYVCCSWQYAHLFKRAMEEIARKPKAMIIWNKVNPAQNLDKYYKQHEIIFYYGDFGGQQTLRGDIWTLARQKNSLHPTMKPIELIAMALSDQPDKRLVMDSFLGSGSTLIACEQTNRICYGMELDCKYVDVIVQRWVNLTNGIVKLNGKEIKWVQTTKT